MWYYKGNQITESDIDGYTAFVYIITNLATNRKYIGKKKLFFKKRKQKNKKTIKYLAPSDWMEYYGSSEELKKDIELLGKESFRRDILYLCKKPAESSYLELYEQMVRNVLLNPDLYYNSYVGARIHRNHVKFLANDFQ